MGAKQSTQAPPKRKKSSQQLQYAPSIQINVATPNVSPQSPTTLTKRLSSQGTLYSEYVYFLRWNAMFIANGPYDLFGNFHILHPFTNIQFFVILEKRYGHHLSSRRDQFQSPIWLTIYKFIQFDRKQCMDWFEQYQDPELLGTITPEGMTKFMNDVGVSLESVSITVLNDTFFS